MNWQVPAILPIPVGFFYCTAAELRLEVSHTFLTIATQAAFQSKQQSQIIVKLNF